MRFFARDKFGTLNFRSPPILRNVFAQGPLAAAMEVEVRGIGLLIRAEHFFAKTSVSSRWTRSMRVPSLRASMKRVSFRRSRKPRLASAAFFREEPEAYGNLRAVEDLAGEGEHVVLRFAQDLRSGFALVGRAIAHGTVHEVGVDEGTTDLAFAGLVGGYAAIGEDEAGHVVLRFAHDLR